MKKADLVFKGIFRRMTRGQSNPGYASANRFWPILAKSIESSKAALELTADKVLREHFAVGYTAANTLKTAYQEATSIKVIHHMDNRSLPTVTALFFLPARRRYELSVSFSPETGSPLLVSRSEAAFLDAAA
jgi:hypothetical protein